MTLYNDGQDMAQRFFNKDKEQDFHLEYQEWYTPASRAIQTLANERYAEFKSYYEIDPKRKELGYETYVIQDYMKHIVPSSHNYPGFSSRNQVVICLRNQLNILRSVLGKIEMILESIDVQLLSDLQDAELETAYQLMKVNLRAAGALAGVVIEHHLQKATNNHGLKIKKKNPAINDLSQLLKSENLIDTQLGEKLHIWQTSATFVRTKRKLSRQKSRLPNLLMAQIG